MQASNSRIKGLEPFVFKDSEILILGSMPSVKSLDLGFYFMHKQNRMWPIIETIFNKDIGLSASDRQSAAKSLHLAFFDVIESCIRQGSLDSAIYDYKINDINTLLNEYQNIKRVIVSGSKAHTLFKRFIKIDREDVKCYFLPSTSPANAKYTLNTLCEIYKEALLCS